MNNFEWPILYENVTNRLRWKVVTNKSKNYKNFHFRTVNNKETFLQGFQVIQKLKLFLISHSLGRNNKMNIFWKRETSVMKRLRAAPMYAPFEPVNKKNHFLSPISGFKHMKHTAKKVSSENDCLRTHCESEQTTIRKSKFNIQKNHPSEGYRYWKWRISKEWNAKQWRKKSHNKKLPIDLERCVAQIYTHSLKYNNQE